MGYRSTTTPPPNPEDMLHRFAVRNGATMKLVFSCNYYDPQEGHSPHHHDFVGWPSPTVPGDACQMLPPRDTVPWLPKPIMRTEGDLTPIHLSEEGYTTAAIVFEDSTIAANIDADVWIDEDNDSIVRVNLTPSLPTFSKDPVDVWFTVFVKKPDDNHPVIDAVCHGILTIAPGGPFPSE